MEILLLSTLHENAAGILRITPQEIAVYDPVTGKKKMRVVGAEYADDLLIPVKTDSERVLPAGALAYDPETGGISIGDGETAGGNPVKGNLEARVSALEDAVGEFEDSAMAIIGE